MKNKFVDIHHHLAYGMDDGPKSFAQMQKMLHHAAEQGIGTIIATPHVTPGVQPFPFDAYIQVLAQANDYCAEKGLDVEVLDGCEVLYTDQTPRLLSEGRIPTLNGTDFVLVEFSPDIRFSKLCEALSSLQREGYRPVIAHVERYECLVRRPSRVEKLKDEMEVWLQMNCSSVIRRKSWLVRYFVHRMLEDEYIDALGTDAHNVSSRAANMKEAYEIVKKKYGAGYAKQLTNGSFFRD